MKEKIILIGGGGHCRSCIDVIEQEGKFAIHGIVDVEENLGKKVLGYNIFATDDQLLDLTEEHQNFLITIGQVQDVSRRMALYQLLEKEGISLCTVISPRAYVSTHATVGAGTIIMHGAVINAAAKVGNNCIINSQALIEHDAVIGDHCHISTGAMVNGGGPGWRRHILWKRGGVERICKYSRPQLHQSKPGGKSLKTQGVASTDFLLTAGRFTPQPGWDPGSTDRYFSPTGGSV